ncbi:thiamine pyrophosphate-dependent dehydrogenase E1 component subunit alpha [Alteromonas sp. a30]|uniref:thiamine pyrophosphate-dependent dehydrogenase E1 component subunit alpha n=1 Tax=Alteromonas sp. a30 TaxID=2730917 RepID=UPI00227DE1F5|nr:thiamine pyrophosphate-dependent dehydrogenase E1 component subunit alpha [Alteromonas sp. a30]MCY7294131.1 thiamine pyrophosphate-dependent dehydrogenase E1 component subunit alpha [Alteromonas sp. a30]
MKTRNHLSDVGVVNQVNIISNGLIDIPMLQILAPDGTVLEGAVEPELSKETALKIFQTMQFIRVLDERMVAAQRQGRISFYLASTGEEAASAASAAALSFDDMIMSQYREQAALAYRGYTTEQFMNQMFSNEKEPNKGRQMPIHYGAKELNFMTISSPLGTQIPQAAGYAYGQKMEGKDAMTICYFGEGAASEGDFHAGLNMAAVLSCPVIFFCRNNGYAISTPADEQFKGDGIASRGIGYGIKTIRVDGNDALAIYAATQKAREIAVSEKCPVLIEAMSYRLAAHSTSDDPTGYRSKEEEAQWKAKDPIARMANWLVSKGWLNQEENAKHVEAMRQDVLTELKRVEKVPVCPIDDLVTDVYSEVPWHLEEQLKDLKEHIKKYPEHYPKTAGRVE